MIEPAPQVQLFFDGACPLCAREVRWLRRLDRRGRVRFTDIADPAFDARATGKRPAELMATLHARLPDDTWLVGVDSFRAVYSAVGLGPLVALSRLPGVSWALDRAYELFARNRLRLTGRCEDGACVAPGPSRLTQRGRAAPADGAPFVFVATGAADQEAR